MNVASVGQARFDLDDPMLEGGYDGVHAYRRSKLRATLRLVVDPALAEVTGRYFDGERESRALDQAYDLEFRQRLRKLTESLIGA